MSLLWSVFRFLLESLFYTGTVVAVFAFIPEKIFLDFRIEPVVYKVPDFQQSLRRVKPDYLLDTSATSYLYNGDVIGPEAFAFDKNYVYTGLADGRIIKVDKNDFSYKTFARINDNDGETLCDDKYFRIEKCGRPLGMDLDDTTLHVIDANLGLFKINLDNGEKTFINISKSINVANGRKLLYNDVVLDPIDRHIAYISISSTKWPIAQVPWSLIEHENSGMLIAYNLLTGRATKLVGDLYFSNGIDISSDKKYIYVSQTTNYSVGRLSLDQVRELLDGKQRKLILDNHFEQLVGEGDNVIAHNGKLYVGYAMTRIGGPTLADRMSEMQLVRKAIGGLFYCSSKLLDFIRNVITSEMLEEISFKLSSGHAIYPFSPNNGAIGIYDEKTGKLERLIATQNFRFISEAAVDEYTGDLWLGSFRNRFIGRISAKNLQV